MGLRPNLNIYAFKYIHMCENVCVCLCVQREGEGRRGRRRENDISNWKWVCMSCFLKIYYVPWEISPVISSLCGKDKGK